MKSIMEEASSISKAIDLAWNRAGRPLQFSIKILEEPERNMFGLTVKSAKIALFFEERKHIETRAWQPEKIEKKRSVPQEQPHKFENHVKKHTQGRSARPAWTESLSQEAIEWVNSTLKILGLDISYTSSFSGSAIKFVFDRSPTGTEQKDRMIFSSFACLILATLRNRHKRHMRNLKVILHTA